MLREKLLKLQQKDIELIRFETRKKELEAEKEKLNDELLRIEEKIGRARGKLDEKKRKLRDLKDFVRYKEERIEDLKRQKRNSRNREEFKRFLRNIAKGEDEVIKTKQQIRGVETEVETLIEAYLKVKKQLEPDLKEIGEKAEEIEREMAIYMTKIENTLNDIAKIKSSIPEENLREFERLKAKFGGLVFSDISSGACEGCGITYSSAEFKELLSNLKNGQSKCPYCGRFIYKRK